MSRNALSSNARRLHATWRAMRPILHGLTPLSIRFGNSRRVARKLTHSGVHWLLWCFVLEYKSYVCSHTAHHLFLLGGWVSKTVISGEAFISPCYEFCFWDWVKFWDKGVTVPDETLVLGK